IRCPRCRPSSSASSRKTSRREPARMPTATFRIWRGDASGGALQDYRTEISEGMVVLDAVHRVQAEQAPDLACRWNCKAGKCGSWSAEINGRPRLLGVTPLNSPPPAEPGPRPAPRAGPG